MHTVQLGILVDVLVVLLRGVLICTLSHGGVHPFLVPASLSCMAHMHLVVPRLLAECVRTSIHEASVRLQTFPIVAMHAAAAAVCLIIVFCWSNHQADNAKPQAWLLDGSGVPYLRQTPAVLCSVYLFVTALLLTGFRRLLFCDNQFTAAAFVDDPKACCCCCYVSTPPG
jgi:hypothetical protein